MQCPHCIRDPRLHSFHISKRYENLNHICYLTTVREAHDKNVSQIVEHIEGYLSQKHSSTTWEWAIDCKDFRIEWHTLELTIALQRLIQKYGSTLYQFRLFNVNVFMRNFLVICRPFLDARTKRILVVEK